MAESIKVRVQAEISNYNDIVKTIRDAVTNGIIEGVSSKSLSRAEQELVVASEQLKGGSIENALKSLQHVNDILLKIETGISDVAGIASTSLAAAEAKVHRLKDELQAYQKENNPRHLYRRRSDGPDGQGEWVRSKASIRASDVGMTDETWKTGKATLRSSVEGGSPVEIDYGGSKWSLASAVRAIVAELNRSAVDIKQATDIIHNMGYEVAREGKDYVARLDPNQVLTTKQYNERLSTYDSTVEAMKNRVKEAKVEAEELEMTAPTMKVKTESGNFENPIPQTVEAGHRVDNTLDEYRDSVEQTERAIKKKTDAEEKATDATNAHTKAVKQGTTAQNYQTGAVSRAITTFFGYQMVLRQLRKLWREAIHTITELDKQLTNQAMVTGLTREETWKLVSTYQDLADATGLAQTTIASVTTEYLRQGESLENALTLTKAAAAAATVAGISASDSVKYLTTAIHGFKLEAEDALAVSDKFAALAADAATNYEDLAVALSKVASQAALAGMSMDYTLALLTAGLDVTQEAPESIGTALKTVIARMREISDYGKTLEDDVDLNQVEAGLRAVGIALRDGVGELRSTEDVLDELGRKWSTLSANQQAAVAKALAGTRQQSRLVAIMENYDKVLDYQATAMNSVGATTVQQVKYLQGMEAATNRLQSAYQSLITNLLESDEVINLINFLTSALKWFGRFLSQPAGRWALFSIVLNFLTRSKQLMERIKATVDQLVKSLSGVQKTEQQLTREKKEQIRVYQQLAQKTSTDKLTSEEASKIGGRPNGWMSNRTNTSGLVDVGAAASKWLASRFAFGPGYGERRATANETLKNTASSWWNNNSIIAKIQSAALERKANKAMISDELKDAQGRLEKNRGGQDRLAKLEEKIAKIRTAEEKHLDLIGEKTKEQAELEEQLAKAQSEGNQERAEELQGQLEDVKETLELAHKSHEEQQETLDKANEVAAAEREAEGDIAVYTDKRLSDEQKAEYITKKKLLNEQEAKLEKDKQLGYETSSTEEKIKQLRLEIQQTQQDSLQAASQNKEAIIGAKLSNGINVATAVVAAVTVVTGWIQEMVDIGQNYASELAAEALDKAKKIQSEMYENTQLMSTIQTSAKTFEKLSEQVVKSTDDMKELGDAQKTLAESLNLSEDEVAALGVEGVNRQVEAKQAELQAKNKKLAEELNETLTAAGSARSGWEGFGNIMGKIGAGAGTGSLVGGGIGMLAAGGPITAAFGGAIGAMIGGVTGLVTGIFEEIQRSIIAADARNKINALLDTDEGVEQFKYAIKLNYQELTDIVSDGNSELANALGATFSSIVELFDADELRSILAKYNYDMSAFAADFNKKALDASDALTKLYDDESSIATRVQAAQDLQKVFANDEQISAALSRINATYLSIGRAIGNNIQILDDQGWAISDVSNLINTIKDTDKLNNTIEHLDVWLKGGAKNADELTAALTGLTNKEIEAVQQLITHGRSLQDVADTNTRNRNQVQTFRETQAKWESMSETEQQRFIDENEKFFSNPEWAQKFFNGEYIGDILSQYQKEIQDQSRQLYEEQRAAAEIELQKALDSGDEIAEKAARARLILIDDRLRKVDSMFDLTLSEIVDKQNEQIAKVKEMYQAEEEALTESLQKRKEAYQDYFNTLQQQERVADYVESRDQIIDSITRLSGGTDAASRNKIRELQKQLKELEEQEAKQRKEDARQAVLDNIDDQISDIQEKFDKLLNNNQELLASMDANTEMQYLAYLGTTGKTEEEQELIKQEMGDLLRGRWESSGRQDFDIPTASVPVVDVEPGVTENSFNVIGANGEVHSVELSAQQMQQLITQMLQQINKWTGSTYAINKR